MEHSHLENTKTEDAEGFRIWVCVDCGVRGRLRAVIAAPCETTEKTSQEQALLDAIGAREGK